MNVEQNNQHNAAYMNIEGSVTYKIRVPDEISEMTMDSSRGQAWTLQPRWRDEDEGDNTLMSLLIQRYPEPQFAVSKGTNQMNQETYTVRNVIQDDDIITITLINEGGALSFYVHGNNANSVLDDILSILHEIYNNYGDDNVPFPGMNLVEVVQGLPALHQLQAGGKRKRRSRHTRKGRSRKGSRKSRKSRKSHRKNTKRRRT